MNANDDTHTPQPHHTPAPLIYRAILTALSLFLFGLTPLWDRHTSHFGFGFLPTIAGIVAFYPLLLLVLINLVFSLHQIAIKKNRHGWRALILDLIALAAIAFGAPCQ